jgi:TonB family protein
MISDVMEGQSWSRRHWWWMVVLVFGAQVAVVFWLGERGPVKPRPPGPVQTLRFLRNVSTQWLALNDPTLFALPHREGFSASAWLAIPTNDDHPFDWTEDPDWLRLPKAGLGLIGSRLDEASPGARIRIPPLPATDLPIPELFPTPPLTERSRLRLEGQLAGRLLLTPFQVPDPTNSDILTNTVVQMVVDSLGRPRSLTLLASSGFPAVDDEALSFARTARFDPLPGTEAEQDTSPSALARLAWGTLIFDWHTMPLPPTNAIPSK